MIENIQAMEIYQVASIDAMGITVQAVLEICDRSAIDDPLEILLKVSEVAREIQSLEKE